jgi:hypothetical protein
MTFSNETIEAVAKAMFKNETGHDNWHEYHDVVKNEYIDDAKAALAAVERSPEWAGRRVHTSQPDAVPEFDAKPGAVIVVKPTQQVSLGEEQLAQLLFETNPSRNKALEWRHSATPKKKYRDHARALLAAGLITKEG